VLGHKDEASIVTTAQQGTSGGGAHQVARLALARQTRPKTVHAVIVIPVYNEQATIELFMETLRPVEQEMRGQGCTVRYIFVNDGSVDDTLETLIGVQCQYDNVDVVDLSRNFGKEAALTAGIAEAVDRDADVIVPIDVDLQDPPSLIIDMLKKWRQGYQVVLARRIDRSTDNPLKAWSALAFYRFFNALSRHRLPENVGDFRLMDRQVAAAIGHLNERGRMMKALMNWVGFSRTFVDYRRQKRSAGRSTFNPRSLLRLGLNGFVAFSAAPLRAILMMGLSTGAAAVIYSLYIVGRTMVQGVDVPGYASTIVIVLVAAALQLTTLGIVGEYIARLFEEVKGRPNYLVGRRIGPEDAREVQPILQGSPTSSENSPKQDEPHS